MIILYVMEGHSSTVLLQIDQLLSNKSCEQGVVTGLLFKSTCKRNTAAPVAPVDTSATSGQGSGNSYNQPARSYSDNNGSGNSYTQPARSYSAIKY